MSKRESGLSNGPRGCHGGGPVFLKRRISGRGRVVGLLISATKLWSDCVLVAGSVSAVKVEDTAQSSQEEQYFSGVCVSLSPDFTSDVVWQGGAEASAAFTEVIDKST